jgi:hypothetical protein
MKFLHPSLFSIFLGSYHKYVLVTTIAALTLLLQLS